MELGPKSQATRIATELLESLLQHADLSSNDLWQLHEDRAPQDKFKLERRLLEQLIDGLLQSNPGMISRRLILDVLLNRIIGVILDKPALRDEVLPQLGPSIENLLNYTSHRDVYVPIVNIELGGTPLRFGDVEFVPIKEEDRQGIWWDFVKGAIGESTALLCVVSFGRVRVAGDLDNSTIAAGPTVDDALLILRGISFPFTRGELVQIGTVGDVSLNRTQYYRLGKPTENARLEFPSPLVARLGPPLGPYRLREDLLSKVPEADLKNLLQFINTEGFNPAGRMASKVLRGIRWIGEASKIDSIQARFAKLTVALENLIGGEPKDEKLTSVGLTAMLAERAAFLVGSNTDERLAIDKDVRAYYGKRSDIVHGRTVDISDSDFIRFASLVRDVSWALLRRIDEFNSVDELQRWIRQQRYS